jgi:hypothetical protein
MNNNNNFYHQTGFQKEDYKYSIRDYYSDGLKRFFKRTTQHVDGWEFKKV